MIGVTVNIEEIESGMSVGFGITGENASPSEQLIAARFISAAEDMAKMIAKEGDALSALVGED